MTRSSTPSKRPQTRTTPAPAAPAPRPALGSAARRAATAGGGDAHRSPWRRWRGRARRPSSPCPGRRRPACRRRVRCLSVAKARISTTSSDQAPARQSLAGKARAQRSRKNIGEDGEDARPPHLLNLLAAATRPTDPTSDPAISTAGTCGLRRTAPVRVLPPASGRTSIRSPAPKLWMATTVPRLLPARSTTARPTRSA